MRDRRLAAEKTESMDDLIALRDGYVAKMASLDNLIKLAGDNVMMTEELEDKWIGSLRSYEFICQKITKLGALDTR